MPHRVAVVGGGISGLTFAHRIRSIRPDVDLVVLESGEHPGGKVRTSQRDGYSVEWGPNGFLTRASDTLDLAHELGLTDDLRTASPAASKRYVVQRGTLRPVPSGPASFLGTPLLGPLAKLRVAAEPLLATRGHGDVSVHAFLSRHLGRSAADALAEVLVLGVTGGDPKRLSVTALFPRLVELEREHRSLVLGMVATRRSSTGRRPSRDKGLAVGDAPREGQANASGRLMSLSGGTGRLTDALARRLGDVVRTGAAVVAVRPGPMGIEIDLAHGHGDPATRSSLTVDHAVLATPAFVTADLVEGWAPALAADLRAIPFAPIRVIALGYDRTDVPRELDGFGFLAPSGEGVRSLGVLWSSTVFPDRAPPGKVLLRVLAGGVRDPEMVALDEDDALAAVRADLRKTMGITVEPEFVEQVNWPNAIPQYELGHVGRVEGIEAELVSGRIGSEFVLIGNSYRGVGINDAVREARQAADRLASALSAA